MLDKPFIIFADCEINYDGRACSTLDRGNYLIIYKNDGSLQIHGSELLSPLNYQGSGSKVSLDNNKLLFTRKKETIEIILHNVYHKAKLENWSFNKPKMKKTEADLVNQLESTILSYIDNCIETIKEYKTDVGPIDLLAIDSYGTNHVMEVKRGKANISACSQVERYVASMNNSVGYIVSPQISKNALKYCKNNNIKWLEVNHN